MKPRRLRAVLFDWDGTLVDSAAASLRTYAALFASFGIDFGPADFERSYSPDWYRTYEVVGLPRSRWDEADARWLALFAHEATRLLPGSAEGLELLRERGVRRGLVTSGSRPRIERDLARLDVAHYFDVVVCGGDTEERKPHARPLRVALQGLGASPHEAAYLGDSPEDIEMALAAGVYAVGIPGGFPNRATLEAALPDHLAPDLAGALRALLS